VGNFFTDFNWCRSGWWIIFVIWRLLVVERFKLVGYWRIGI